MAEDTPGEETPKNPFEELLKNLFAGAQNGSEPDLDAFMGQVTGEMAKLRSMFSGLFAPAPDGSILNSGVVKDTARAHVATLGPDPTPDDRQRREVREAIELADQWLSEATTFDPVSPAPAAWARAEWIEATMPTWQRLTEPVVSHLADALEKLSAEGAAEAPEVAAQFAQLRPMLRRAAGAMFGAQMGQALGQLASDVVSGSDLGLPLDVHGRPALLPTNVAKFGEGLDTSRRDLRLYLALREVARQRLFASVGWLGPQLLALVEHFAREITIDRSALEQAFEQAQGTDPNEAIRSVQGTLFEPHSTPEQLDVLGRLETLLALVEGWVDDVVTQAARPWLSGADALGEAVRRRRAVGGPTENALQVLVGLQLRPRRVRDGATVWAALRDKRGVAGRDEVWRHPDLIPTAADLDDPLGYVAGESRAPQDDLDRELEDLLNSDDQG